MAWAVLILLATSPFAIRCDLEKRMYALIVLLTTLGLLAIESALRKTRPANLIAVGAVTGLLLYTQYWSLYLVGVTGASLIYQAWHGRPKWRTSARLALCAGQHWLSDVSTLGSHLHFSICTHRYALGDPGELRRHRRRHIFLRGRRLQSGSGSGAHLFCVCWVGPLRRRP